MIIKSNKTGQYWNSELGFYAQKHEATPLDPITANRLQLRFFHLDVVVEEIETAV